MNRNDIRSLIRDTWDDPLYRFLLKAVFLFIAWYFIYELWLHPQLSLDLMVIQNLESISSWILEISGYRLIPDSEIDTIRTVGIDGTNGIWIGDPCNGITLFVLFSGFVISFPGPLFKKAWFIPLGIIAIHLLNVLRICGLAMILYYSNDLEVLDFNHTYTFTIIVYSFVFWLWYLWANRLSGVSLKKPEQ